VKERALYADTDSVIYVERTGEVSLPLGNLLGDFTNELDEGDHITTFISGGAKNYSYRTLHGIECCKVRGFTLNHANSKAINFSTMKDMIQNDPNRIITTTNPSKIHRDKYTMHLYSSKEDKQYRMVNTKRVFKNNFTSVPFGY
jgi:hypothetical protein